MSRKLWVGFLYYFESVHGEVTPERPLFAAPQGYLRGQGARARLVGEHPHHPRPLLHLFEQPSRACSSCVAWRGGFPGSER